MLRMFVELVLNVVSTLQMNRNRPARDWHTGSAQTLLPRGTTDTQPKEPLAAPQDSPIALMVSSTQSVRPSNHERVLTTVSHTAPSPSVSRAPHAIHLPLLRMGRQAHSANGRGMLPPPPSGGGGGLRALARKTEGALCPNLRPLISAQT